MSPAHAITILPGLDRDEIERRRAAGEFFWVDLTVPEEASIDDIARTFGLDEEGTDAIATFGRREIAHRDAPRRVHADEEHVVFPFWLVANPEAGLGSTQLRLIEVNVLVHGDFLLTVHREDFDLRSLVGTRLPSGRSERYAVYVVLAAMTASFFRALLVLQDEMGALEADLFQSRRGGADARARIRDARVRLTELRSVVGPEQVLFERAGEEIDQVGGLEGDHRDYFERINKQLDRILEGIDAASAGLSSAVDVQLNETSYRLTILATIFLPLTFITGFFGMNFAWMVDEIASQTAFWLLGVAGMVAAVLLICAFLAWQGVLGRPMRPPRS